MHFNQCPIEVRCDGLLLKKSRLRVFAFITVAILLFSCGPAENDTPVDQPVIDSPVPIDSMKYYAILVEENPSSTDAFYYRARYCIRQGLVDQALLDLETAMNIDSTIPKVRIAYGDVLLSKLAIEDSKVQYEFVLATDSSSVPALMGMSRIYALLNNNANAIAYLSRLLTIDPHYADAYFLKGMIYRADFYETGRKESWDRAMSSYQTAVEQNPDYYAAYVEMGVMHDQVNSDLAIDYYNSALDIYPESIEAWYNIGMFFQKRGELDTALATYRRLNEIDSTYPEPYFNQGYIHMLYTEKLDSAIYYFEKATHFDPEYFQAFNNIGLCYEKLGNEATAVGYYQKAVKINPDFDLAKENLRRLD